MLESGRTGVKGNKIFGRFRERERSVMDEGCRREEEYLDSAVGKMTL